MSKLQENKEEYPCASMVSEGDTNIHPRVGGAVSSVCDQHWGVGISEPAQELHFGEQGQEMGQDITQVPSTVPSKTLTLL